MAGIGSDFAPSVAGEKIIDDRGGNGFFQVLGEGGADGGNDNHPSRSGLLKPRLKEGFFLSWAHELPAATAPVPGWRRGRFGESDAEGLLHARNSGATDTKKGRGLFQSRSHQRGKQNGLAESQGVGALGVTGDFFCFIEECGVDGGFSCHPQRIANYISS